MSWRSGSSELDHRRTLTRRLAKLGHGVRVANSRDPETLSALAEESGARAVWAAEATTDADLVIVSIPQKNVPNLAAAGGGARPVGGVTGPTG